MNIVDQLIDIKIFYGNKILAHFMDVDYTPELNYHEDWNKLIPVLCKLRKCGLHKLSLKSIKNCMICDDKDTAWSLIVGYINKHMLTEEEYLRFKIPTKMDHLN